MDFLDTSYGLTGGIGTGKSAVSKFLQDLGAHIIDTDIVAREIVEPGKPALVELTEYFGGEILNDDGTLNRELLRARIIRDRSLRETLNDITHPRISEIVLERIREIRVRHDGLPVIVDVPLLYEVGWDSFFPRVILAYAPVAIQIERLMQRDGLDRETAQLTLAAQMNIDEKRGKAKYIIDNSGTLEETRVQVADLFRVLQEEISRVP